MILRIELLTPGPTIVNAMDYNRLFTLHGVTMVWLFLIPAIPSVFGNFLRAPHDRRQGRGVSAAQPRQPLRLHVGAVITLWGMVRAAADTGWTFYTPYSTHHPDQGGSRPDRRLHHRLLHDHDRHQLHRHHPHPARPDLGWLQLPLFVWAIYGTSIIQVLATPVLGIRSSWSGSSAPRLRHLRSGAGGRSDSVPAPVLVLFAPGRLHHGAPGHGGHQRGVSAFSRKNILRLPSHCVLHLGLAFVGFFTWGHHMFSSGMAVFDAGAFAMLSMFVGIFTAIKVFTGWARSTRVPSPNRAAHRTCSGSCSSWCSEE